MDNSNENHQNVFHMTHNQPCSGYASLSLVEAYWEALRAGRDMPKRAEIDPRGIESALEYAFILERVAPGVARMRIAGSHLHDLLGMEARGMPLTSFFEQDARLRIAGLLEEVFQTPGTAEVMMHCPASPGQPALEARMILLPLKSDLGDVSRILGCLVSKGEIGTTPRRFVPGNTVFNRLGLSPEIQADGTSSKKARDQAVQGFAEGQKAFAPDTSLSPSSPNKRPAYLRLVVPDS